jgi:hypothetical protein
MSKFDFNLNVLKQELEDSMLDFYMDQEDFDEHFDEKVTDLKCMSDEVELYRVIFLESLEDLNKEFLGHHWVINSSVLDEHLIEYLKDECSGKTILGDAYLLKAKFSIADICFETTLTQYMMNPSEDEIFIKKKSVPLSKLSIINTKKDDKIENFLSFKCASKETNKSLKNT